MNMYVNNVDDTHCDSKMLLTHQLQHLLVCFDVYLETFEPKPFANATEFRQERICSRLARYLSVRLSLCTAVCRSHLADVLTCASFPML